MIETKESLVHFFSMSLILLLFGPTAFIFGIGISIGSYFLIPKWLFLIICIIYIIDIYIIQPQNKLSRKKTIVKTWNGWKYIFDWFETKIHIDDNFTIIKNKAYIICMHPHGIFSWGNGIILTESVMKDYYCNKECCKNKEKKFFEGKKLCFAGASIVFKIPFVREIYLALGVIDAKRKNIEYALKQNISVGINVDGIAGVLSCKPGVDSVVLKNRTGFIKLALKTGSPLIPVYQFGLVDNYNTDSNSFKYIQEFFHKKLKCGLPIFFSMKYGLLPYRNPQLNIVVGKPIIIPQKDLIKDINDDLVNKYHAIYINELVILYNKWKGEFGFENRQIQILDAHNPY
jgi:hypothetical protein